MNLLSKIITTTKITYHCNVGVGVPVASTTISRGSPSGAHMGSKGLTNFGGSYKSDFSITTISSEN